MKIMGEGLGCQNNALKLWEGPRREQNLVHWGNKSNSICRVGRGCGSSKIWAREAAETK